MNGLNLVHKTNEVENHLVDDMSRKLYEIRMDYAIYRNKDKLISDILNLNFEWQIPELDELYQANENINSLIIFGSGSIGKYTFNLLNQSKYKNEKIFFCDNNPAKWNTTIKGGGIKNLKLFHLMNFQKNTIKVLS